MKVLSEVDFGPDVSLYRSAADTLRSDDTLQVGSYHGLYATPGGRAAIGADLSTDVMLGVGAFGSPNAFNTASAVIGLRLTPVNTGTGAVTAVTAQAFSSATPVNVLYGATINTRYTNTTGTLNNAISLNLPSPAISTGAVVNNAYGMDMAAQKVTGVTTGYALYQRGTSDFNVFLGNTGMGVTAPTLSRLQFPASTVTADGITWGTDTNLYRSAPNQLRTDGQMSVGSILGVMGGTSTDRLCNIVGTPPGTQTATYGLALINTAPATSTGASTGLYCRVDTTAASFTTGMAMGIQIPPPAIGAGSSITDLYGLFIGGQTGATGRNVGAAIGTSGTATLWVSHNTNPATPAGGITFGSLLDTNLYRGGPDLLRTDDNFSVGGYARIGASGAPTDSALGVGGPYKDAFTWSNIAVTTTDPQAADKGGTIMFGGSYTDAGAVAPFARLVGAKTTGVSGEFGGYLALFTRPNGGNMTERLRVSETGAVNFIKNEAQNLVTHKLAAAPASPVEGQRYYDTVLHAERIYTGTKWDTIGDITTVSTAAPPVGTNNIGDLWWDSDEVAMGTTLPLGVTDGGTGATSPATARSSLAVPAIGNSTTTAGAPTAGTWARGDQYLDSAGVVWTCVTAGTPGVWSAPPGTELAYNQITAPVTLTNGQASSHLVVEGTTRSYDGSPIIVEIYCTLLQGPTGAGLAACLSVLDGGTDLGIVAEVYNFSGAFAVPAYGRRRFVPSAGSHNYRLAGWVNGGSGTVYAGVAAGANQSPTFIRVTRA